MKNKIFFVSLILFTLAVIAGSSIPRFFPKQHINETMPRVTVAIAAGESIATYDGILAATAYDALLAAASSAAIPIEKKQYDFGVFIEQIGDKPNTKDRAWIYYVNGIPGDVASDKKNISNGDIVQWQYVSPLY